MLCSRAPSGPKYPNLGHISGFKLGIVIMVLGIHQYTMYLGTWTLREHVRVPAQSKAATGAGNLSGRSFTIRWHGDRTHDGLLSWGST